MKKTNRLLLACGGAALTLGGAALYLIAPGRVSREQTAPFIGRNFAHRGLFDESQGIPENSLAAFRRAVEAGYGVELDTRLTRDGYVVVSHDNDLTRMTGRRRCIDALTLAELQQLPLQGTGETVPLFSDALDILCAGAVPVIVEIKPMPSRRERNELCKKVLAILDEHGGDLCVESFDPFTVRWFRRHAPDILRGQLTSQREDLGSTRLMNFALSRLFSNVLARPQFIAHHTGKKALTVRLCERLGAMRVCWTAHDRSQEQKNDAVIFEHFLPPVKYR